MLVTEETVAQLENYTRLKELDLSGSTCYDAIMDYISAHPQVEVKYTVQVDDLIIGSRQKRIEFDEDDYAEKLIQLSCYLPAVEEICIKEEYTSAELITALRAAFPKAKLEYRVNVLGLVVPWDAVEISLPELYSDELPVLLTALDVLPQLQHVDLGHMSSQEGMLSFEDVGRLQQSYENIVFDYGFTLYEREFSTADETMDLSYIPMVDRGEAVKAVLPYMTECEYLDMDSCGVSDEDMAAIRAAFPRMKVVWRINFGQAHSFRTDTERIVASVKGEFLTSESVEKLKYCTDVKYLDLSRNIIEDISFVANMPELEVAVLSANYWHDASPLAACTKLEYLEIYNTECSDISALAGLTNLRHLNICWLDGLTDITPLFELGGLERLWIGWKTPVPNAQVERFAELNPDCEINTTDEPTQGGWQTGARYELLCRQLGYDDGTEGD